MLAREVSPATAVAPAARAAAPRGLPLPLQAVSASRTLVMGVVNVTPDSFSDGGRYLDPQAAVARGMQLHARGADLVDVGGESTRPGASRVSAEQECRRVLPVVAALAAAGVAVSIDTMRGEVALAAIAAGAVVVNDVSGGLGDPDMLAAVAGVEVPYVAMHWRGHSDRMQELARYDDVVADVRRELGDRLAGAERAGVDPARVVLDPGLGFAKHSHHNWALLRHLDALLELGRPVLVGASRKRFLGDLLPGDRLPGDRLPGDRLPGDLLPGDLLPGDLLPGDGAAPRPVAERDDATDAISALAAAAGAWCVRVHDVHGSLDAVRVAAAWAGRLDAHGRPAAQVSP